MKPEALCGLLAESDRLRVYSAVVLGADLPSAVADRTGLPPRSVVAALRRLQLGGLIDAVARTKRLVILEHLAACFEPGVKYPEKAVDVILRAWYSDYASLRRYLVDEELLGRENGVYWRTGGYVPV